MYESADATMYESSEPTMDDTASSRPERPSYHAAPWHRSV